MPNKPTIGLDAIHRRYFCSDDGEQIITLGTLRKWSREMQEAQVIGRVKIRTNGHTSIRLVALEPFFSDWLRKKLCPASCTNRQKTNATGAR
jgi:hypothetical protein